MLKIELKVSKKSTCLNRRTAFLVRIIELLPKAKTNEKSYPSQTAQQFLLKVIYLILCVFSPAVRSNRFPGSSKIFTG